MRAHACIIKCNKTGGKEERERTNGHPSNDTSVDPLRKREGGKLREQTKNKRSFITSTNNGHAGHACNSATQQHKNKCTHVVYLSGHTTRKKK
mmetsp:Transcript_2053/g.4313  ORF Transcript_2053/g.4313 Transcript_2053/m.4313 type:complete len:93 (+) Transcript_2053:11-289(+)